jgi:SAM-dependent methyltransferase
VSKVSQGCCRACGTDLRVTFANLGNSPLANSFLAKEALTEREVYYPLHAMVCETCFLVQLDTSIPPAEIFEDYLYFSSHSTSWLDHARRFCEAMTERLKLTPSSLVIEIASNDGYLLKNFVAAGIPVLGIEPAKNIAEVARGRGIPTRSEFFGSETATKLAREGFAPSLTCANNVLAHVPDINDFVEGFRILLKPESVATFEFPHLLNLIHENQFDTIYHEHYSYLSLLAVERLFARHGLEIFDVEQVPTHGGSLRIFAAHKGSRPIGDRVLALRKSEADAGLSQPETYSAFAQRIVQSKCEVLDFLVRAVREGRKVVGYGAPAKGNTMLNYFGVGPEFMSFTVDRSPQKQGLYLPGTRIPILAPEAIFEARPDYVVILPWNLKDEISEQMAAIREFGGKFVTAIPHLSVW